MAASPTLIFKERLLQDWEKREKLLAAGSLALYLDFDGTLAPIADKPSHVRLRQEDKRVLRDLASLKEVSVYIVTGRALDDIRARVGITSLTYVGNHGLEAEGPDFQFRHPMADRYSKRLSGLTDRLQARLKEFSDILIENKKYTLSVHYRNIGSDRAAKVESVFFDTIKSSLGRGGFLLTKGKKVWELRPDLCWNKGMIVLWLQARIQKGEKTAFPVYVGDDSTDEDAFKALQKRGWTVLVSEMPKESAADYTLRSVDEVYDFLKRVKKTRASDD